MPTNRSITAVGERRLRFKRSWRASVARFSSRTVSTRSVIPLRSRSTVRRRAGESLERRLAGAGAERVDQREQRLAHEPLRVIAKQDRPAPRGHREGCGRTKGQLAGGTPRRLHGLRVEAVELSSKIGELLIQWRGPEEREASRGYAKRHRRVDAQELRRWRALLVRRDRGHPLRRDGMVPEFRADRRRRVE